MIFMGMSIQAVAGPAEDAALIKACEGGNNDSAAKALEDGANPNASGGWRQAPALPLALSRGSPELVELLLILTQLEGHIQQLLIIVVYQLDLILLG